MGAMTKLDAVNRMLGFAGEYPVNSLVNDGVNDTNIAETLLDHVSMQVQMEGLHCNTVKTTGTPDSNGRITVADNTLFVDTRDEDLGINVTTRGKNPTYLFNLDDDTDVFKDSIKLKLVVLLPFEQLPTPIQNQVTELAAFQYQRMQVGDTTMDAALQQLATLARAVGRAADIRARTSSIFKGRSRTARQAARRDGNYW